MRCEVDFDLVPDVAPLGMMLWKQEHVSSSLVYRLQALSTHIQLLSSERAPRHKRPGLGEIFKLERTAQALLGRRLSCIAFRLCCRRVGERGKLGRRRDERPAGGSERRELFWCSKSVAS
jgi:hypothetical protein